MKTCTKCGETKAETEFSKSSRERDGLQYQCKECNRIAAAARHKASPGKRKAAKAKYYAANAGKVKASQAEYRANNLEKLKTYKAEYMAVPANREKVAATNAAYLADHPEAARIAQHNYRARKRENGGRLSKGLADKLFKLQRGRCACCGKQLGKDYHLDHIMPLALGGTNTDDNIQLLRQRCNNQKCANHPIDFMQQRGFLI